MDSVPAKRFFLFCSQALFLWMFFSTSSLERMADAHLFEGPAAGAIRTIIYGYAAEWRHGLAGFWPVYVPGFFAAAIATWLWSIGRSLQHLLPELLLLTGAAAVCAIALAPEGTRLALIGLPREVSLIPGATVLAVNAQGITLGIYSLLAWNAFTLACHRALWWRSFWPLVVPVAMDGLLIVIRPYTFDDLVSTWLHRASDGNLRAMLCLLAVPVSSAWLVMIQLKWEKRGRTIQKLPKGLQRASCFLFGHKVDNRELASLAGQAMCCCGTEYLRTGGEYTRVRHMLRCFFGGHLYRFAGARNLHHEYVCIRCGHPLIVAWEISPQPRQETFRKAVHYPCGVFGHKVHQVTERAEAVEYACFCGHSFLRQKSGEQKIRHPFICVFLGHFIRFAGRRFGFAEFVCRNCGHPFSFHLQEPVKDT